MSWHSHPIYACAARLQQQQEEAEEVVTNAKDGTDGKEEQLKKAKDGSDGKEEQLKKVKEESDGKEQSLRKAKQEHVQKVKEEMKVKKKKPVSGVPFKLPSLALLESPAPLPSTTKQTLSHARAAGEKVSVGFKMEEVETMVSYRSQRDTLLHNVLGGWNPRLKRFRKLRYALVLLREVENCGGAPVKHKNWTTVRARVTGCGVQS